MDGVSKDKGDILDVHRSWNRKIKVVPVSRNLPLQIQNVHKQINDRVIWTYPSTSNDCDIHLTTEDKSVSHPIEYSWSKQHQIFDLTRSVIYMDRYLTKLDRNRQSIDVFLKHQLCALISISLSPVFASHQHYS